MKKTLMRFLTILLATTMLLTVAPINGFAISEDDSLKYLKYKMDNDEVMITRCDITASGEITIPSTIEGKSVTAINGNAFTYCQKITSISIPASVSYIGEDAFTCCTGLTEINVDERNENYCIVDKALYNKEQTEMIAYPLASDDTDIYLPATFQEFATYECFFYDMDAHHAWQFNTNKTYNLYFTDKDQAYLYFRSVQLAALLFYGPFENVYLNIDNNDFESSPIAQSNCINKYAAINQTIQYYASLIEIVGNDCALTNKFWSFYNNVLIETQAKYDYLYYVEKKISVEEMYAYTANDVFDYMIKNGIPEKYELTKEDIDKTIEDLDEDEYQFYIDLYGSPDAVYIKFKEMFDRGYEDAMFYINNTDVVKTLDFKPIINDCNADKEIKYGESVTYTVSPAAPAQEYQWYVNGEYFASGDSCTVDNPTEGYTISVTAVYPNGYSESSDSTSVTVKEQTFLEKVEEFFNTIINAVIEFFKKIFG